MNANEYVLPLPLIFQTDIDYSILNILYNITFPEKI